MLRFVNNAKEILTSEYGFTVLKSDRDAKKTILQKDGKSGEILNNGDFVFDGETIKYKAIKNRKVSTLV